MAFLSISIGEDYGVAVPYESSGDLVAHRLWRCLLLLEGDGDDVRLCELAIGVLGLSRLM
ncbi:hypothetical protein Bca52824_069086 [Brassica carinata]|uniref:Uncharacterized protein n=1 Tax=Brassica carinata TaxID=52824 RepID=A0A8X7U138_BRACI|nr:hypothetical protein Bca52824_069086 [Brassica carinata]